MQFFQHVSQLIQFVLQVALLLGQLFDLFGVVLSLFDGHFLRGDQLVSQLFRGMAVVVFVLAKESVVFLFLDVQFLREEEEEEGAFPASGVLVSYAEETFFQSTFEITQLQSMLFAFAVQLGLETVGPLLSVVQLSGVVLVHFLHLNIVGDVKRLSLFVQLDVLVVQSLQFSTDGLRLRCEE